jgi:hypothetical protein
MKNTLLAIAMVFGTDISATKDCTCETCVRLRAESTALSAMYAFGDGHRSWDRLQVWGTKQALLDFEEAYWTSLPTGDRDQSQQLEERAVRLKGIHSARCLEFKWGDKYGSEQASAMERRIQTCVDKWPGTFTVSPKIITGK